jgi:hypothetical protein
MLWQYGVQEARAGAACLVHNSEVATVRAQKGGSKWSVLR